MSPRRVSITRTRARRGRACSGVLAPHFPVCRPRPCRPSSVPSAVPATPEAPACAGSPAPSPAASGHHAAVLGDVLDCLPHAVLAVDAAWRVEVANARARTLLARVRPGRAHEAVLGVVLWDLLPGVEASEVGRCCQRAAAEGVPQAVDGPLLGRSRWFRVHAVPAPNGRLVLHVRDASAERRLTARIEQLADRDPVTGAANRRCFTTRVAEVVATVARARAAAPDAPGAAVLLLDLDGFAALNAARGRDAGDQLLRHIAACLGRAARGGDTVARVGPDEFAVLLEDVAPGEEFAAGQRLLAAVAAPFAVDGEPAGAAVGGGAVPGGAVPGAAVDAATTVRVTACLGATVIDGASDADMVLRDAGAALARARATGPGRLARCTPALHAETRAREQLVAALREAADRLAGGHPGYGGFSLAYQPVVDLATGAPTGVEALLRWVHPVLGPISPATFIPLAEELGLVAPLGHWMLRAACAAVAGIEPTAPGGDPLTVAVNVSGYQLQASSFADEVAEALAEGGLAPARLTVEVTETALVRDPRRARRVLGELRATGVRVAIDDFGTGYSSLGYLQQLPLDVLKIDKRFVDGLAGPLASLGPSVAIPRAIVALGEALGLRTVGEGVETAAQRDALRAVGCTYGQGYLFARPLPVEELAVWLATRTWAPPDPV